MTTKDGAPVLPCSRADSWWSRACCIHRSHSGRVVGRGVCANQGKCVATSPCGRDPADSRAVRKWLHLRLAHDGTAAPRLSDRSAARGTHLAAWRVSARVRRQTRRARAPRDCHTPTRSRRLPNLRPQRPQLPPGVLSRWPPVAGIRACRQQPITQPSRATAWDCHARL